MDNLIGLDTMIAALVGVPALIAVVINVLKKVGVVKEGQGAVYSQRASAVIYLALYLLPVLGIDTSIESIDALAQNLSGIGASVLALIPIAHKVAGYWHDGVKGLPLIGKTLSD